MRFFRNAYLPSLLLFVAIGCKKDKSETGANKANQNVAPASQSGEAIDKTLSRPLGALKTDRSPKPKTNPNQTHETLPLSGEKSVAEWLTKIWKIQDAMEVDGEGISTMKGTFPDTGLVVAAWVVPKNWDDESEHPAFQKFELRDEKNSALIATFNNNLKDSSFDSIVRRIDRVVDLNGDGVDEVITESSHLANGGYAYKDGHVYVRKSDVFLEAGIFTLENETENENGTSSCKNSYSFSKPDHNGLRTIVVTGSCGDEEFELKSSKLVKLKTK